MDINQKPSGIFPGGNSLENTTVKRTAFSVGTTPIALMQNDPNRISFLVMNLSANNMWFLPDQGVSSTNGIPLIPLIGNAESQSWQDAKLTTLPYWIVADAATSAGLLIEVLKVTP